jgi:hypothetical protein
VTIRRLYDVDRFVIQRSIPAAGQIDASRCEVYGKGDKYGDDEQQESKGIQNGDVGIDFHSL